MTAAAAIHWVTFVLALGALGVAAVGSWVPKAPRVLVVRALVAGLVLEAVSACARWIITGHPPIFGTFENTLAASWAVGLAALWRYLRPVHPRDAHVSRLLLVWAALLPAYGLLFPLTPYPLTISERSILIDIHVAFAWAAFALLLTASMAGLDRILAGEDNAQGGSDEAIVRGLGLGFALLTAMIVVGAIYSFMLFGDWYRWEIVGASAMAAWLGYGASLHAYLMFGWRGRRLAWCAVAMLPLLLMVFWSWSIFSGTYHFFDISVMKAR